MENDQTTEAMRLYALDKFGMAIKRGNSIPDYVQDAFQEEDANVHVHYIANV